MSERNESLPIDFRELGEYMYRLLREVNPSAIKEIEAILGKNIGDALSDDSTIAATILLLLEVFKDYIEYILMMKRINDIMTEILLNNKKKQLVKEIILSFEGIEKKEIEFNLTEFVTKYNTEISTILKLYNELFNSNHGYKFLMYLVGKVPSAELKNRFIGTFNLHNF